MRYSFFQAVTVLLGSIGVSVHASMLPSVAPKLIVRSVDTVFQFKQPAWIENLAVRSNNNILFTLINPIGQVWEVNPAIGNNSASLIASFESGTVCTGITELEQDVFAVANGHLDLATGTSGNYSIWKLDLRSSRPIMSKVMDVVPALLINGITTLDAERGLILATDSFNGVVYRIDVHSATFQVVLEDPTMKIANTTGNVVGINGIKHVGNHVYYDNTNQGIFCRVAIHPNGTAAGPYEIISRGSFADDFFVFPSGEALVVGVSDLLIVGPSGSYSVVAGSKSSSELAGDTAVQVGRARKANTVYVTTNGGQTNTNGTTVVGGKIVALQVDGLPSGRLGGWR